MTCLCLAAVATLPPAFVALSILALSMAMLGMGNGAVFQLVPQRFPDRVGILTGIVGAAGGFGGFLLPSILGSVKQATGSFGIGFVVLAAAALGGVTALFYLKGVWRRTWPASAARRAGLLEEAAETSEVYATSV